MPAEALASPARRALFRGRVQPRVVMRLPWALGEDGFTQACTRCAACVDACPGHVLAKGDGGFPEFDPHAGECTFCGDCVRACTAPVFDPQALDGGAGTAWNWHAVIGEACLATAGVHCQACRDTCPTRAIAFPMRPGVPAPALDATACTACGACVGACPASAITLQPAARAMAA